MFGSSLNGYARMAALRIRGGSRPHKDNSWIRRRLAHLGTPRVGHECTTAATVPDLLD